ncbi:hypothetical protein MIDIC_420017 [Alphaproteobacteria bacterium]
MYEKNVFLLGRMYHKRCIKSGVLLCIAVSVLLTSCTGGFPVRRKWQKAEDFEERREIAYNIFVEQGGLKKKNAKSLNPGDKKMRDQAMQELMPQDVKPLTKKSDANLPDAGSR